MFTVDSWNDTFMLSPKLKFEEIQIVYDLTIVEKQRGLLREVIVFHEPAILIYCLY